MASSKQFGPGQQQPHTDGRGQSGQGNYQGGQPNQGGGNPGSYGTPQVPSPAERRAQAMRPPGKK